MYIVIFPDRGDSFCSLQQKVATFQAKVKLNSNPGTFSWISLSNLPSIKRKPMSASWLDLVGEDRT